MKLIEWEDNFNINIKIIDEQHKKLIEMINLLHDSVREGKGNQVLGQTLNDLIDYANTHFRVEEKLLDDFSYPEVEFHKEEHRNFIQKITDFKDALDLGKIGLSIDVLTFLKNWITYHILNSDKKYGPFLINKGIK